MTHDSRLTTFVDTHTHLYEAQFDADRTAMIERAINTGVSKMIIPNVDATTIKGMLDLVQQFPTNIFPMMGLHPCYVKPESYKAELEIVRQYLFNEISFTNHGSIQTPQFVAVGEIGLDLYWDKSTLDIQKEAFELQCDWAIEKQSAGCHSLERFYTYFD
jgi:TatD DNase family protein